MNPIFPELPTKLGIYSLTQMLDSREHSELYLAKQSYVDRVVVIEVLRPDGPPELVDFFRDVVRRRAAASLPHVVPVLESAQTGRLHYLIQELPQGRSLGAMLQEGELLNAEQVFNFVQSVADMYCACLEQGMAANPLTLDSIYVDGDSFSFFSPVISGEVTDEQRVAQMEAFASILEMSLSADVVEKTNLSVAIHWLRHGYGNMPLEWPPLASSLNMLRAQKLAGRKESIDWREALRPSKLKRRGKRVVRELCANVAFVCVVVGVMLLTAVGVAVFQYVRHDTKDLPAVTEDFVYCGSAGNAYRVQARPVSIEEYARFLHAWDRMTNMQKKDLSQGMPSGIKDHTPLQWNEQSMAANLGMELQGRRLTNDSPVCGVSYWGALAYARYVNGELPSVAEIKIARQHAGEPMVEEWTSSGSQVSFPLESGYVVYPAHGGEPTHETNPANQENRRGFRVVFKHNTNTEEP